MKKINVAIIGVGNFTKALVEGVAFYTAREKEEAGLMNPVIGNYRVRDINFVAAFDVDERKVGKKLHQAISAGTNWSKKINEPLKYDVIVQRGPTFDGVIGPMRKLFVHESKAPAVNVEKILKESKADIVVNLVPSGGEEATYKYAEAALNAGCSFINCIPTPLATIPVWQDRFLKRGLVLLGDDIKSQLGATMLNRFLLALFKMRGIRIVKAEQENRGGNADHFNLQFRREAKEKSKKGALTGFLDKADASPVVTFVYTGENSGRKRATINIKGEIFGRTALSMNAIIDDEISINGAGVLVDAIRAVKLLVDKGKPRQVENIAPFLVKSPPKPMPDSEAYELFKKTIKNLK